MHSSRMRTGCSLTVCHSLLLLGGSVPGGVWSGGCLLPGGCLLLGDVCSGGCLLTGGVCSGGCLLMGVSANGGVCSKGGVCSGGCLLRGCLLWRECLLPGGVCSGGCQLWGMSAPRGVSGIEACTEADTPPPVDRITDACKNITLATTSLRPVKIHNLSWVFNPKNQVS